MLVPRDTAKSCNVKEGPRYVAHILYTVGPSLFFFPFEKLKEDSIAPQKPQEPLPNAARQVCALGCAGSRRLGSVPALRVCRAGLRASIFAGKGDRDAGLMSVLCGSCTRRVFNAGGAAVLGLLVVALVGVTHEIASGPTALEQYAYMQQSAGGQQLAASPQARFTQLPNYVVTGAVNAPSGGAQAPPGGVAMQFPGNSDATDDQEVEEKEKLTEEEKKIKKEEEQQKRLKRQLGRTKARTYRIRARMSELRRWIKAQSKEVLQSVAAQTAKIDSKIMRVPGVVGPEGARGKAGVPGKNGLNGAHGAPGDPGPDGEPGEPGPMGAPGPMGPPGVVGKEGVEGAVGSPGPAGKPGPPGGFGPQGVKR